LCYNSGIITLTPNFELLNCCCQAKEFNKAVKLSGISITKLDGTAKGGIVFAIADELKLLEENKNTCFFSINSIC
jgi:hypothetical protein